MYSKIDECGGVSLKFTLEIGAIKVQSCRFERSIEKRAKIARFLNVAKGNISLQKTDPLSRVRVFVIVDYFLSLSARF